MKIGIAGYGYVGQAHEAALKDYNTILISDPAKERYDDLRHSDAVIICVSTPMADDGSCDMSNVYKVIEDCPNVPILIKSTISLEGWQLINRAYPDKDISFSPEFLRANSALEDFKNNDTILLGGKGTAFWCDVFVTAMGKINIKIATAEELILTKYFRNSFLAAKVSFFNQIYDLCQATNTDADLVCRLVSDDSRIGPSHTQVTDERGYGGHCFPKDVNAIIQTAKENNVHLSILEEVDSYNMAIRKTK
jgi:UDPglucose 6-dehydrogenase